MEIDMIVLMENGLIIISVPGKLMEVDKYDVSSDLEIIVKRKTEVNLETNWSLIEKNLQIQKTVLIQGLKKFQIFHQLKWWLGQLFRGLLIQ